MDGEHAMDATVAPTVAATSTVAHEQEPAIKIAADEQEPATPAVVEATNSASDTPAHDLNQPSRITLTNADIVEIVNKSAFVVKTEPKVEKIYQVHTEEARKAMHPRDYLDLYIAPAVFEGLRRLSQDRPADACKYLADFLLQVSSETQRLVGQQQQQQKLSSPSSALSENPQQFN